MIHDRSYFVSKNNGLMPQGTYEFDAEGKMVSLTKIEGYGSRHRSAYHLCNTLHDAVAIVVSQDGNVQLATWRNGIVTCWDLTSQMFIAET